MEGNDHSALPERTVSALRNRQSVRATFKLTPQAIEAISVIAVHLGIKQKSLFDHLVEDHRLLAAVAREKAPAAPAAKERVQKTYVLSRRSLLSLEKVSKEYATPRDALVEDCVRRLMPVIQVEKAKHRQRVRIMAELSEHFKKGMQILNTSERILDADDPVRAKIERLMSVYGNIYKDIEGFIRKGDLIEHF